MVEVVNRIVHTIRGGDTVARLGGDEFLLLLPEIDANHVIAALADPPPVAVWVEGVQTRVVVHAHRETAIIENEKEMYIPLTVTRIEPMP